MPAPEPRAARSTDRRHVAAARCPLRAPRIAWSFPRALRSRPSHRGPAARRSLSRRAWKRRSLRGAGLSRPPPRFERDLVVEVLRSHGLSLRSERVFGLALRELRRLSGALETGLLPLLGTRVARQETGLA